MRTKFLRWKKNQKFSPSFNSASLNYIFWYFLEKKLNLCEDGRNRYKTKTSGTWLSTQNRNVINNLFNNAQILFNKSFLNKSILKFFFKHRGEKIEKRIRFMTGALKAALTNNYILAVFAQFQTWWDLTSSLLLCICFHFYNLKKPKTKKKKKKVLKDREIALETIVQAPTNGRSSP